MTTLPFWHQLETEGDQIVKEIKSWRRSNHEGDQIVKKLKSKGLAPINPKDWNALWEQDKGLTFRDGLIVVHDDSVKQKILEKYHDTITAGHPGRAKTKELITRDYWWPKMMEQIHKYVDGCRKCQQTKIFPQKPQGELNPNAIPTHPFHTITVDFVTDLPQSQGHDSIMNVVCRHSKRLYSIACNKAIDSKGTARLFQDHIWWHEGLPKIVISDRGPQFASEFTCELYKLVGIKQNLLTAYHPQTDGQTEQVNQEVEQYLRLFINYHQDDWVQWLPIAEFSYNNCASSATGVSPFFTTKGREVNTGILPRKQGKLWSFDKFALHMDKIQKETEAVLTSAARDMKKFYDWKRTPQTYEVGENVLVDASNITSGRPKKKLDWKCLGPFEITRKISNTMYEVKLPESYKIHPRFHVSKLRRFIEDKFNRPKPPRVQLHVRGEDWDLEKVLASRISNNHLKYFIKWKNRPERHNTWELESRLQNNFPHSVAEFHRQHPSALKWLSMIDFSSIPFIPMPESNTIPIEEDLPTERELNRLVWKTRP